MKIAFAFVLGVTLSLTAHAQTTQPLTALDYFEIQQLASKYARAIDTCSNNGYDYADLFTADGYFQPEQSGSLARSFRDASGSPKPQAADRAAARTLAGSSRV